MADHGTIQDFSVKPVKVIGLSAAIVAGLPALYQWALAFLRFGLFLFVYHGETGVNHADDFAEIYGMDAWAILVGLLATLLLWGQGKKLRGLGVGVLLANLLGAAAFFVMHGLGILVTYDEFIRQWGHSH